MRKIFLIATIVLLSVTNSHAQDMRSIIKTLPDTILPSLTLNDRLDFIDYLDSKMKAEVSNRLGGKSEMTAINDTYTHIRLSGSSEISLKLLPLNGDSVICMVRTYSAEGSDSKVSFYTKDWKVLNANDFISTPTVSGFLAFPDSLNTEERFKLINKIEVPLIKATLSESSNDITFTLTSHLYLNEDDRNAIVPYIKESIAMKWNDRYE